METQSSEISQLQEARSEIRLTSEKVSNLFKDCKSGITSSNRVHVNDLLNQEYLNGEKLRENHPTIEKFADQLRSPFFNQDVGCEWHEAGQNKFYIKWAKSEEDVKKILALFSGIGLGRFTTTRNQKSILYRVCHRQGTIPVN
ncbi:MAG: hypothetical protein PHX84_03180 [Candidatus Shapirobacteria bacterium]|jgi:hypothetical protein|nr:hypothetical protein [Candidatus Shapirobacteria bacterium]